MTPAIDQLERAGVAHEVVDYEHDPDAESYGEEAADVLGLPAEQVFKTLLVELGERRYGVAIVPVSAHLDLKALAQGAGVKRAVMADPADAQRVTGYVLGGISPFGQRRALPTFVDESVEDFEQVYVSGGRRGLEIAVAPADMIRVLGATVVPLAAR